MSFFETKTKRQLRIFGAALTLMLCVFGSLLLWRGREIWPFFYGGAGLVALLALLIPRALTPIELVFATVAKVVMEAVTYVVLTVFFVVAITPLGLGMRLFGKDLLGRKFDRSASSYWVPVEPDGPGSRPDKPY